MLNPQAADEWFVDLSSPHQFEDKNGSFALILSYIQMTRAADELKEFFEHAGASYVTTCGAPAREDVGDEFNAAFILGVIAERARRGVATEGKVFWFETNGIQAFWCGGGASGAAVLTKLAKALFNIP